MIIQGIALLAAFFLWPIAAHAETATLTVVKGGAGRGVITSAPEGIHCGKDCSAPFNRGTLVTLTAQPDPGFVFVRWKGCKGKKNICKVAIKGNNKRIRATFKRSPKFILSITKTGIGDGVVRSSPVAPASGYDSGTLVALTATASSGSAFSGWTGACTGTTPAGEQMLRIRRGNQRDLYSGQQRGLAGYAAVDAPACHLPVSSFCDRQIKQRNQVKRRCHRPRRIHRDRTITGTCAGSTPTRKGRSRRGGCCQCHQGAAVIARSRCHRRRRRRPRAGTRLGDGQGILLD